MPNEKPPPNTRTPKLQRLYELAKARAKLRHRRKLTKGTGPKT
jgi:hypothetical protein